MASFSLQFNKKEQRHLADVCEMLVTLQIHGDNRVTLNIVGLIGCPVNQLKNWANEQLPLLNEQALQGKLSYSDFGQIVSQEALCNLPDVESLDESQLRPMLTLMGMLGSSTERHAQQQALKGAPQRGYTFEHRRAGIVPGKGLATLVVNEHQPFRDYFYKLADRMSHPYRDSLQSLILWNGPQVTIKHPDTGEVIYRSPVSFEDGTFLSFTGESMERYFLGVIKETVALQAAANEYIMQLCEPDSDLRSEEMQTAARTAAQLIWSMQVYMHRFMKRPDLDIDMFLDVIRQYDCPWHPPEQQLRPVSVANDVHSLYRDIVLFDNLVPGNPHFPGYREYIRKIYCVMLPDQIAQMEHALSIPTLQTRLTAELANESEPPDWIWAYVDLYNSQRDMSRAHFALVAKFLLQPSIERKKNNDPREYNTVVNNSHGTTGMDPIRVVKYLDKARAAHPLQAFNKVKGRPSTSRLSPEKLFNLVEMPT